MSETLMRQEVSSAVETYEQVAHVSAIHTRRMIENHGEIEALSSLMDNGDLQKGFKALRDSGQLDKSFEAVIIRYPEFFDTSVVEVATFRLEHADQL